VEITSASTDDIDAVVDMWVELARGQQEYGSHLSGAGNRPTVRETIVQRIVTDDLLIARREGAICGFVMVTMARGRYEQTVTRGIVENLYVTPEHRREGIGTALLEAGERRLADAGATVISLEAMADNDAARQFYAAHGYAPHRIELEKPTENDTL